MLTEEE